MSQAANIVAVAITAERDLRPIRLAMLIGIPNFTASSLSRSLDISLALSDASFWISSTNA